MEELVEITILNMFPGGKISNIQLRPGGTRRYDMNLVHEKYTGRIGLQYFKQGFNVIFRAEKPNKAFINLTNKP